MQKQVYVDIDSAALAHNFQQVADFVGKPVLAVIKANAYGHGLVEAARLFDQQGAWGLAVTRLEEAAELRSAGLNCKILVFAPVLPACAEQAVALGVIATVDRLDCAVALSRAAAGAGVEQSVHVKVDTGMGRIGVEPAKAVDFVRNLKTLPAIAVSGIYTHFKSAYEKNLDSAKAQLDAFVGVLNALKAEGLDYGLAHCANSSALLRLPEATMDIVRPGTLLYGQYPSKYVPKKLDLRSTWKLMAAVVDIREIPPAATIGYGGEFTAKDTTKTAIIATGWADGFTLVPEGPLNRQGIFAYLMKKARGRRYVLFDNKKLPVLGRVSMQMTNLDITGLHNINIGDYVEVPAMRIPVSCGIPRIYSEF